MQKEVPKVCVEIHHGSLAQTGAAHHQVKLLGLAGIDFCRAESCMVIPIVTPKVV